ncbi:MAG: winged helix-turn-helix domain-containing protein [Candidatus Bathyarchaeia archaeon]
MSYSAKQLKYVLNWLIAGSRGGAMRARIIMALKESPMNANQLANLLEVDYRTIRHHLEILEKNKIISSAGEKYAVTYFLTTLMEENYTIFEEIWEKIGKKEKRMVKRNE